MKKILMAEAPGYVETLPSEIAVLESPSAYSPERVRGALWYAFGAMCSIREHRDEWLGALEPLLRRMGALGTAAGMPESLTRALRRLAELANAVLDGRDFKPVLPGSFSLDSSW